MSVCHCSYPSLTNVYKAVVIAWLAVAGAAFMHVSAVSYGSVSVTNDLVSQLQWLDSWQFSI